MHQPNYFICEHCGNIATLLENKGVPLVCCGQKMTPLHPNTTDAATEKHVPVYTVENGSVLVTVGSTAHPMLPEHLIEWIALYTKSGVQHRFLAPGEPPQARFSLGEGDAVEAVYAYCNLHGLWKA